LQPFTHFFCQKTLELSSKDVISKPHFLNIYTKNSTQKFFEAESQSQTDEQEPKISLKNQTLSKQKKGSKLI
jgi:hypothetical protein